jgi:hypothetical protein
LPSARQQEITQLNAEVKFHCDPSLLMQCQSFKGWLMQHKETDRLKLQNASVGSAWLRGDAEHSITSHFLVIQDQ